MEQHYWEAFWGLAGDRQSGGPLPWLAIWTYYQAEGFGRFHDFQRIIKTMDGVYLKAIESRDKQD